MSQPKRTFWERIEDWLHNITPYKAHRRSEAQKIFTSLGLGFFTIMLLYLYGNAVYNKKLRFPGDFSVSQTIANANTVVFTVLMTAVVTCIVCAQLIENIEIEATTSETIMSALCLAFGFMLIGLLKKYDHRDFSTKFQSGYRKSATNHGIVTGLGICLVGMALAYNARLELSKSLSLFYALNTVVMLAIVGIHIFVNTADDTSYKLTNAFAFCEIVQICTLYALIFSETYYEGNLN